MVSLQYYTFRRQSISSTVVLGVALIATFYLINFRDSYNYDSGVLLDNSDFNILIWTIAGIGIFSVFLSIKPSWIKLFKSLNEKITKLDRLNSLENDQVNEFEDRRCQEIFVENKKSYQFFEFLCRIDNVFICVLIFVLENRFSNGA